MSNQQATGLALLGLAIIVILAGIAASLSPLGLGAAVVGPADRRRRRGPPQVARR
jgi:hypothetical protein